MNDIHSIPTTERQLTTPIRNETCQKEQDKVASLSRIGTQSPKTVLPLSTNTPSHATTVSEKSQPPDTHTPSPPIDSLTEIERSSSNKSLERECNHLLSEIGHLEMNRPEQGKRFENIIDPVFSTANIGHSRITSRVVKDSVAMKQAPVATSGIALLANKAIHLLVYLHGPFMSLCLQSFPILPWLSLMAYAAWRIWPIIFLCATGQRWSASSPFMETKPSAQPQTPASGTHALDGLAYDSVAFPRASATTEADVGRGEGDPPGTLGNDNPCELRGPKCNAHVQRRSWIPSIYSILCSWKIASHSWLYAKLCNMHITSASSHSADDDASHIRVKAWRWWKQVAWPIYLEWCSGFDIVHVQQPRDDPKAYRKLWIEDLSRIFGDSRARFLEARRRQAFISMNVTVFIHREQDPAIPGYVCALLSFHWNWNWGDKSKTSNRGNHNSTTNGETHSFGPDGLNKSPTPESDDATAQQKLCTLVASAEQKPCACASNSSGETSGSRSEATVSPAGQLPLPEPPPAVAQMPGAVSSKDVLLDGNTLNFILLIFIIFLLVLIIGLLMALFYLYVDNMRLSASCNAPC